MQCNHNAAKIVEQSGGTKEGHFVEVYECPCGATGRISGEASQTPSRWTRTGPIFD